MALSSITLFYKIQGNLKNEKAYSCNSVHSSFLFCLCSSKPVLNYCKWALVDALNNKGELGAIASGPNGFTRQFYYEATFDFDAIDPGNYRTNGEGYKVYPLNDGGNKYHNTATIWDDSDPSFNNIQFPSDLVEVEFANNQSYDRATDPELAFLNLGVENGTEFDFIGFGFFITDEAALNAANTANDDTAIVTTDFYLTLIFNNTLLTTDDSPHPIVIDPGDIIKTAGEFAQKNRHGATVGWAQVLGDGSSVAVNAVPIPGALFLLGSGLFCLVGLKRRK
ncbi:MAG: hypothetical protein GY699_21115 [Desulfobacteraceae bacterium]|nr:hypothetical protein [Desulfobacteraceae bacterium]